MTTQPNDGQRILDALNRAKNELDEGTLIIFYTEKGSDPWVEVEFTNGMSVRLVKDFDGESLADQLEEAVKYAIGELQT